ETNKLVGFVEGTSKLYDAREYDAIVSSGENVTAGLMALRLQEMGIPARSWQGWQVPINTTSAHGSARFMSIPRDNLDAKFAEGFKVAVVAGFQGLSEEGRITTLGRGGSDTTAVAFAAAFGAERCDIYTDVDGIYTTDPRITSKARKLDKIAFEEMLELASLGAKVLQTRRSQADPRHGRGPAGHRRGDLRALGRGRDQRRHDRAEHLGEELRRPHGGGHRHDLLLPDKSGRPRQEGDGGRPRQRRDRL